MTSTSWLSRDLNVQALDKMRKLSDSEQTAYECWVYQENNQFFVTDLNTRLKVTINPKKLNKIKSQFVNKPNNTNLRSSTNSNSTVNSSSHELVRILVKQYLYSSMIDFKSKKKEPFVFMFLEDFDVSTGKNLAKKATDLNKLNIGTHPSVNRPTIAEKHPTSTNTNIVTRSASKTVLKENTPMATYSPKPSPMRVSDHLRAYTKQKTAEKQKSEKREEEEKTKEKQTSGSSNLSQLINQISQDSSLQDCTIEMIATTPTRMKTRRAGLGENEKKRTEPMNLDEGFFKSGNTQSTLGSTMSSNHSDDLLLLDVESQQILDKKNGGLKLSSQCPTNFSQFDVNCSVISCAPDECSKSSIKITRKTSKAKDQAATAEADPVDQEMRSCEDDENNRVENTVHVADKDETRIPPLSNPDRIIVRDTQAIAASNENGQTQNSPSQLLKRRDTVTSAISDMSTSIFEWPAPITAACSTMDAFTSSTLNYSLFGGAGVGIMCQPTTMATTGASATKRRKKKLFSQHDRACFNDDGDDDDDEEDDDLNESASQYNYRSTHNTPSNARFSRAKMLSSKTASIQKALTPLPTTPSRRRRADESADSTERRSSSESGAGRNQGADDEAKRIRTLLTSSSSSSSTSSLVSFDDDLEEENSSCVTSATANTTNKAASALLFKPRHLFEYKRRLMARRAETERKPTLLTTVSSSASIASSRINNRLFSVRDIFSPSRYNPRKRTMTTITPPSSNRQQQLVNDTGSEPRHQQLLRANSRLLDNAVSLDLGPANKDQNAQRFNSNTSQNSTPSRRRLFDPKNQDINHAFGMITHPTAPTPSKKMNTLSIQPQRSISESRNNNITTTTTTTTSSYPDITSMNNTTATTTTTTSSDQTTATTSSSDKSIPGGQYPNNQAVAANDTNNDTNKTTSILDPHSNMFDHKFSLNVDDFQDFLAIKNSLVESSADHV